MSPQSEDVVELLRERFEKGAGRVGLDREIENILAPLELPLLGDEPRHSQAAEAALTIVAFSLSEGRVLDLRSDSPDVSRKTGRIPGDRTVGDLLCERLLVPRNIPATKGPFQSSTWRSGYRANQARAAALSSFLDWHENASLLDLDRVCDRLVATFLGAAANLVPLPKVDASSLTFARFRSFLDELFQVKSGGAFEQYCFAALLQREMNASGADGRVVTKSVRSSDSATGAAGDVIVRRGGRIAEAYEVTARPWRTKLGQLSTSARAGLTEVTIVANDVGSDLRGAELEAELAVLQAELAVDVIVIDLRASLDLFSGRIGRFERADVIRQVYANLVQWHRREPHLVASFVGCLASVSLALDEVEDPTYPGNRAETDESEAARILEGLRGSESMEALRALARLIDRES